MLTVHSGVCTVFSTGEEVRCVPPDRLGNNVILTLLLWKEDRQFDLKLLLFDFIDLTPVTSSYHERLIFCTISAAAEVLLQITVHHLTEMVVKHVLGNYPLQRGHTSVERCSPCLEEGARKIHTLVAKEVPV